MKVFLIIVAVLVIINALILSLSAEITLVFDKGWHTRVRVWFIEKDVVLSKILNFVLFPQKAAQDVKEKSKAEKEDKKSKKADKKKKDDKDNKEKSTEVVEVSVEDNKKQEESKDKPKDKNPKDDKDDKSKPNYIQKLYDKDGIVGIMGLVSNLLETVNSAVITLIKGLHIYSLYVRMVIGGGDASDIAQKYGGICGMYYPLKGMILNSMKVDQYDDDLSADYIANTSEYEFQLIASINVALLVKILFKAGKVFVVNLIKNK